MIQFMDCQPALISAAWPLKDQRASLEVEVGPKETICCYRKLGHIQQYSGHLQQICVVPSDTFNCRYLWQPK